MPPYVCIKNFRPAVPNIFGHQRPVLQKTIFPWTGMLGYFQHDSSTLYLLYTLILLLLYQLYIRSSDIRSRSLETPVLDHSPVKLVILAILLESPVKAVL